VSEGKTIIYIEFLLAYTGVCWGLGQFCKLACLNELISIHGSVAEVHAHGCLLEYPSGASFNTCLANNLIN
jgi:hypothetical protein